MMKTPTSLRSLAPCALLALLAAGCAPDLRVHDVYPAESYSASSAYETAYTIEHGLGVARDYAEAARLYALAAEEGDARALNNLGLMAAQGRGMARSYGRAADYFGRSAALQDSAARYNLGLMHETGLGMRPDLPRAVHLYRGAADQGNPNAQFRLAGLIERGLVPDGAEEALRLYRRAAELGHAGARQRLADLGGRTAGGWELAAAGRLPGGEARAVDLMVADVCACSGRALAVGRRGVRHDHAGAFLGDPVAAHNLAVRYAEGREVPQDDAEAVRLWQAAAQQDYAPAQYALGLAYVEARGTMRDDVAAAAWLSLAARHAGEDGRRAGALLAQLEARMPPEAVLRAQKMAATFVPNAANVR